MKHFRISAVLVASGLLIGVACNRTETRSRTEGEASREMPPAKTTGTAFVRFVSAMNAHTNTDLYFGNTKLFSTSDAEKPTGYKPVPAERRDFILREAGKPDGMEIEKNSEGLRDGKHYTVVGYEDNDGKPVLRAFNDDESAPAAGKAKVRLIHAAPGIDPVSVYAPGRKDKFAGESRFSTASTWQEVDPVNGPLVVRAGDEKTGARASVPAKIEAGKLYTFVVEGGPKSGEKLRVMDLVDSPTTQ
jgi:hypothetical protein